MSASRAPLDVYLCTLLSGDVFPVPTCRIPTCVAQDNNTESSWYDWAMCLHVNTLAINPEAAPATMPCQIAVSPPFLTIT